MLDDEDRDWVTDLEAISDLDDLARTLHESGLAPDSEPRIEVLFNRAMLGTGRYSQLLRAYVVQA